MLKEFRDYLLHGRAADLAIAVILAVAFGDVIRSFVANIMSPLFGVVGNLGLADLDVALGSAILPYGMFLNDLIGFLMVAAAVYIAAVRPLNAVRARSGPAPGATVKCSACRSTVPSDATRCAFCTSHLVAGETDGSPVTSDHPSHGK